MKIPNSELVKRIIRQQLKRRGTVNSQERLGEIVRGELEKIDESFQISPERARRIALEIPQVEVTVETRKTEGEKPENCPACGGELTGLYAKNLKDKKTEVGFRCDNCGYHGDIEAFMPMRYTFKLIRG
jgi:DNA-directed RNA polymerase subunit M/transcription elongation factor TFIIS